MPPFRKLLRRHFPAITWFLARSQPRYLRTRWQASHAVVVAGWGRCGTTLLFNALSTSGHLLHDIFFINRFDERRPYYKGICSKTHDLPPPILPPHVKVIFLFGNPMNAALSAFNAFPKHPDVHFKHIDSPYTDERHLFYCRDVFQLTKQFDAWYKPQGVGLLTLRYETLYAEQTQETLQSFLGFELKMPPYRARKTDWQTHPLRAALQETYGALQKRVEAADDARIWLPR